MDAWTCLAAARKRRSLVWASLRSRAFDSAAVQSSAAPSKTMRWPVGAVASFLTGRVVSLVWHEAAHAAFAVLLGCRHAQISLRVRLLHTSVTVRGISESTSHIIRHAGWVASLGFALAVSACPAVMLTWGSLACWLTAVEAIGSDLLGLLTQTEGVAMGAAKETFFCGNFGLLVLRAAQQSHVLPTLRVMIRTTMLRGAQSAGVVAYMGKRGRGGVCKAKRTRVVNGKRTDLCDLLFGNGPTSRVQVGQQVPQLFVGHTRFATSSRATMDGCHPHAWSPPTEQTVWRLRSDERTPSHRNFTSAPASVEAYITHSRRPQDFRPLASLALLPC